MKNPPQPQQPEGQVGVTIEGARVGLPPEMLKLLRDPPVKVTIDGVEVSVPKLSFSQDPKGRAIPRLTTIFDAAQKAKINIPVLCHREYMTPVAVCRVCSVEVGSADGRKENRLAPACYRPVEDGMQVSTAATSERVRKSVTVLTELLMADHPPPKEKQAGANENELTKIARSFNITDSRYPKPTTERGHDDSSLVIAVDHDSCILCDRCIRGCNEIRNNEVLGRMGKGYKARIAFDLNAPMGNSTCVSCGECMVSCPTGALTHRGFVRPDAWKKADPPAGPVSVDDLAAMDLFQGVSLPFLEWNEGAVVRRKYKKGDIICREGEFGSTAFLIEKGKVDIFIQSPLKHVKKRAGIGGLFKRLSSSLAGRGEDRREEERNNRFIHIDAPVALDYDNPVATLGQGELFGEMTCMSNYPRSATVRASEDCTLLEMLRNVLYILQRSKASRAKLDEMYRRRAVDGHLRSVGIFQSLVTNESEFKRFVEYLRPRVELIRLNPGDVIFRQGDPADHFYLVRIGFVKVSQQRLGGEHVLSYLGPGAYFGEIGLMSHISEIRALAPPGVRTATCSALDHVDVVRIRDNDFRKILDEFPTVKEELLKVAVRNLEENDRNRKEVEDVSLGDFLRQGLMNAQSLLVLDLQKCTRCDECTKACADAHDGVTRLIREGLRFDKYLVASSCRSCLDPYCMVGCPVGSIRRRNSREIIIEDWCIGCGKCAENCPYGNINMHPFPTGEKVLDPESGKKIPVVQQKATMCDLCTEVDGQPSCVYACPHDAAHRMKGPELLELVRRDMT